MGNKKLSELRIKNVKHYAEIVYHGRRIPMTRVQEVTKCTLDQIEFHEKDYAFRFFDQGYIKAQVDGKFVKKPSKRFNESGTTYVGEFYTYKQFIEMFAERGLFYLKIVKCENCIGAVKLVNGGVIALRPGDSVIDPSQVKYIDQEKEQNTERTM